MTDEPTNPFLNVSELLRSSQPRSRAHWLWYGAGLFVLVTLLSMLVEGKHPDGQWVMNLLSGAVLLGLIGAMGVVTLVLARGAQAEQARLEAIDELLQLRRWAEAGMMIHQTLAKPTRTPGARFQGLLYLATVLARFHRFGEAIEVYDHLLSQGPLDANMLHALRLGRAMCLLREDQLIDADRAISELRRGGMDEQSAGLALVELYRDVKTGHPREAVDLFNERRKMIRQQLGHRSADAWALTARAHDMLGDAASAADAWSNATLLSPAVELTRRYPEVTPVAERYAAQTAPREGQ
jgi:tetratricopeptide (TPR) repeat protein